MKPNTHNGFILKYDGYTFPASGSNRITRECYLLMGGLSNSRLYRIIRTNGTHSYEVYHRIDKA
jgi:hypothetical protein